MGIIIKDKYYLYNFKELVGDFVINKNVKLPQFNLISDGKFWKIYVDILGKKDVFYIKKRTLQTYELQAIWKELFYDYNYNGHSYLRPEMKINSEDVVIDAGGCEGFYARYALNAGARKVVIFEPCNDMVEALNLTFKKEIELGKVIVAQKALGNKHKQEKLKIDRNMYCSSSITMDIKNTIEEEIEVITLDKALSELNIDKIDVIKMDIEGSEIDAVKGMKNTIKRYHPKLIIATYHEYYNAIRVKNICNKISKDYKCKVYGCLTEQQPFRPYITLLY